MYLHSDGLPSERMKSTKAALAHPSPTMGALAENKTSILTLFHDGLSHGRFWCGVNLELF